MIKSLTLFPTSLPAEQIEVITSELIASIKNEMGLQSIIVSEGSLMSPGGPPAYAKVIETSWESLESFMAWAQNRPAEENAKKDFLLENGVALLYYEVTELT
jgi:hypothetical protein